jgi:hypothetical protein
MEKIMSNNMDNKISVETEADEAEFIQPLRTQDEISHEIGILVDKVWYRRHRYPWAQPTESI